MYVCVFFAVNNYLKQQLYSHAAGTVHETGSTVDARLRWIRVLLLLLLLPLLLLLAYAARRSSVLEGESNRVTCRDKIKTPMCCMLCFCFCIPTGDLVVL